MAQQEVNNIVQILLAKQAQKLQAQKFATAQQQQGLDNEFKQKQFDMESKRLGEEHDYHQQSMKALMEARKLKLVEDRQAAKDKIFSTASLPAGASFTKGNLDEGGTVQLPQEYNNPDDGTPSTIDIEGLTQHAKRLADLKSIEQQPTLERQAQLQDALDARQAKRIQDSKEWDKQLQDTRLAAEAHEKALDRQSHETIARWNKNNPNTVIGDDDQDVVNNHVQRIANGDETIEQLRKQYSGMGKAGQAVLMHVNDTLGKVGAVPLYDKDKDFLNQFSQAAGIVPQIDKVLDLQPDSQSPVGGVVGGLKTILNPSMASALSQVPSEVPNVSVLRSNSKRFTDREMKAIGGSFVPSQWAPKEKNLENRQAFIDALNKSFDDHFGQLPAGQKATIRSKYGLDKLLRPYGAVSQDEMADKVLQKYSNQAPVAPAVGVPQQ